MSPAIGNGLVLGTIRLHTRSMPATPAERIRSHLCVYSFLPPPDECRRLREAARLTQQEVADAVRVSRPTITSWEAGLRRPSVTKARRWLSALDALREAENRTTHTDTDEPKEDA